MNKVILIIGLLLICFAEVSIAQEKASNSKTKAVIAPTDAHISVIVFQPNCPVKIEKAMILLQLEGRAIDLYEIRNISNKAIESFTLEIWDSDGSGRNVIWDQEEKDKFFNPNDKVLSGKLEDFEIIQIDDELRKKLRLKGELRSITFFMVSSVEFADGTVYNDEKTFKSLMNHLKLFEPIYLKRMQ